MRAVILLGLALAILTITVYWQVGNHDFMILDDAGYVVENANVTQGLTKSNISWAFTAVELGNWHPMTWLSHMLDVELFGLEPGGHHLVNVFIHAMSALLLFLLLLRLTGSLWQSAFVAALFALHPLHVESVAWISERKDVLSAFFCWLTLLLYAEYVKNRSVKLYLLTVLIFLLGLMSKPMLVTLPVLMLLLDFWPLNRCGRAGEAPDPLAKFISPTVMTPLLKEKIPFFILSLGSSIITIYAQNKGGAMPSTDLVPLGLRIANSATAYVKYLGKIFWPSDLAIFYPFPFTLPLWQSMGSALLLLVITVAVILLARRHPPLVTGWFWFLVTLLPVIGLVQVGLQSMADRYTYIPLTGISIVMAWGVPALKKKIPYQKVILSLLAGAVLIATSTLTWHQLGYWRSSTSLFQQSLVVSPANFYSHYILGIYYAKKGQVDEAIGQYQRAASINPHHIETHYHLGIAYGMEENFDQAIEEFRKIIRMDPSYVKAYNVLGVALAQKGLFEEAIIEFRRALAINPDYNQATHNLALALERQRIEKKTP